MLSWEAPSPSPSDYRIMWAPSDEDYLSWRDDNEDGRGNSYPAGATTSLTLTGLTEGTLYKARIRARYSTGEYANNRWSGPWSPSEDRPLSPVSLSLYQRPSPHRCPRPNPHRSPRPKLRKER